MQVRDIMQAIEAFAPLRLKEDWDNVGLQIGDPEAPVRKVLLALTPCEAVAQEAIDKGADMIVTHHPFIFKGVKSLRADSAVGRVSQCCIKHDIALYCAHTNLDVTTGGVNDVLAARLGLTDVRGLGDFLPSAGDFGFVLVVDVQFQPYFASKAVRQFAACKLYNISETAIGLRQMLCNLTVPLTVSEHLR